MDYSKLLFSASAYYFFLIKSYFSLVMNLKFYLYPLISFYSCSSWDLFLSVTPFALTSSFLVFSYSISISSSLNLSLNMMSLFSSWSFLISNSLLWNSFLNDSIYSREFLLFWSRTFYFYRTIFWSLAFSVSSSNILSFNYLTSFEYLASLDSISLFSSF